MKKVFFLLCAFVFSAFAAGQEKTQSGTTGKTIVFEYDAAGNRIANKGQQCSDFKQKRKRRNVRLQAGSGRKPGGKFRTVKNQ